MDSNASLADALRKCIALGGGAGSAELREWATRELIWYQGDAELPAYRRIAASIVIDGFTPATHITGQQISVHDLPDVAKHAGLSEEIELRQGVGELEFMIRGAERGEPIRLGLPGAGTLAKLMTHELRESSSSVERTYWNVSPTAVAGVLDQIRTRLVALVAEIRAVAGTPDLASSAVVTSAVYVGVYGKARDIHISTAQSGNSSATSAHPTSETRPWWKTARALWGFAVGLATIAAAVIAWVHGDERTSSAWGWASA